MIDQKRIDKIKLFLSIVWRQWEPKSSKIPDPYRLKFRIKIKDAWWIANRIWGRNSGGGNCRG